MTHARVMAHSATLARVSFAYEPSLKAQVAELPGATYGGNGAWILPIMHLPTLKVIFATMDVSPAVIANYHVLLRRMIRQLEGRRGKAITALLDKHAIGIAAVREKDGLAGTMFTGMRNAIKAEARKKAIVRNRRRGQHA